MPTVYPWSWRENYPHITALAQHSHFLRELHGLHPATQYRITLVKFHWRSEETRILSWFQIEQWINKEMRWWSTTHFFWNQNNWMRVQKVWDDTILLLYRWAVFTDINNPLLVVPEKIHWILGNWGRTLH